MNTNRKRIVLVAGEASGDLLGAGLVEALRARIPGVELAGIGGPSMVAQGFEAWWPSERLSVMGLFEVLRHLPSLLRLRRELVERVRAWRPDAYVGIDAPDFNLGVERRLKSLRHVIGDRSAGPDRGSSALRGRSLGSDPGTGIRTVHYVSPSVWAWRAKRAARIGESADRVLCLFPMEPPIYARHGVDARFVGHPLAEIFPMSPDREAVRAALALPREAPVLAVLPGSRRGEIARLADAFLEAAARVAAAIPDLRIVTPMASPAGRAVFEAALARSAIADRVTVLDGRPHEALVASDVVLVASGTATLEAMLAKRPMVVGYRLNALTHFIVKSFGLLKVSRYSLPNVLAGEDLVPELMQDRCTPEALAEAVLAYFREGDRSEALRPRFEALHRSLARNASREAAEAIAELVGA